MPNNSHVLHQADHLEVRLGLRSRLPSWLRPSAHPFEPSLCIASIAFATSGCFSMTCLVMALTMPSDVSAESFSLHGPAELFACHGFHCGVPPDPRRRYVTACGARTFGTVALDRGSLRRLAKPRLDLRFRSASKFADGKESAKSFRKPQSMLMSFPVGTPTSLQLRGSENEVLEGR
jgi:hypothetical protein